MARMAKLVAQNTYSDQELLDLYREGIALVSRAQAVDIEGVRYTRADLPRMWDVVKELEQRIARAANRGRAVNYVRFRGAR